MSILCECIVNNFMSVLTLTSKCLPIKMYYTPQLSVNLRESIA